MNEKFLSVVYEKCDNEFKIDKNDIVTIYKKQDHKIQKILRKLTFKIPEYQKIELDKFGSFIFLQIDGKKNVQELGVELEKKFGSSVLPLFERLLPFLEHLEKNCKYIKQISKS